MSKRTEFAVIAYTLALVLLGFVQAAHEAWNVPTTDTTAPARPTLVMIASGVRP